MAKDTVHFSDEQVCCLSEDFTYKSSVIIPPSIPELKELVDMHGESSDGNEEPLSSDEVLIIKVGLRCWDLTAVSIWQVTVCRELLKCVAKLFEQQ